MRHVLTIAGTDPTGAAGITADLGVFSDFGCNAASVITSVVWQNSMGVRGLRALEPDEVIAQLDAVLEDLELSAIKIGMLGSAEIADAVAKRLSGLGLPIVLDPVMASGDGAHAMWLSGGSSSPWASILEVSTLITPNVPEFLILTGKESLSPQTVHEELMAAVSDLGTDILLKAGHLPDDKDTITDFLGLRGHPETISLMPLPRIPDDVRGTGCALSSAIAASLVSNQDPLRAVEHAREYLSLRLQARYWPGKGRPSLGSFGPRFQARDPR